MTPVKKPTLTVADYLVVGLSPVLIMLLVGSLAFFLIEVFFHGEAAGSVRWVMFWFVLAVVLVSRIGIEQGVGYASVYGLGLAAATWLYLVRIHPAFILGMILLGVVWWCAHKLTWDCTLIDESEDASGGGLLQTASDKKGFFALAKTAVKIRDAREKSATPHPPGLWVVYFSLAALPLFGIGQMLLPGNDPAARQKGFIFLFIYLIAALGLLLTTSFLGLRRYLRQRYLQMPPLIALGWIRFGVAVAVFVLLGALILPRPGVTDTWQAWHDKIDYRLHQASDYAARFGPHGNGQGRTGNETQKNDSMATAKNLAAASKPPTGAGQTPSPDQNGTTQNQGAPSPIQSSANASPFYSLFKILFLLTLAMIAGWWIFRRRDLIFQIAQSIIAALKQFFNNLFGSSLKQTSLIEKKQELVRRGFTTFKNPFLNGKNSSWTPAQLILYSYEALQAWSEEQGFPVPPEQTPREFCSELGNRFPEIHPELNQFSFLYSHAAYGLAVPVDHDLEPLKNLWRYISNSSA